MEDVLENISCPESDGYFEFKYSDTWGFYDNLGI